MRTPLQAIAVIALALAPAALARAHDPGLSSATLRRLGQQLQFRVVVSHADLQESRRASSPQCSAADVLRVELDGNPLPAQGDGSCELLDHDHTAFEGAFALPQGGELAIQLSLLDELPRGHRSFARLFDAGDLPSAQGMLTRGAPPLRARVARPSSWEFFMLGVEHILRGADHLLFLGVLLLGVQSLRRMAALVSCFTLAHSLTLALAAFDLVSVSSRLVESLIAASIVLVALRNVSSRAAQPERLIATFGFGLIHGLGFASGLRELGVGGSALAVVQPLLQFNLGVEAGQIGAGALALPALLWLRRSHLYHGLSGVAALIGAVWFVQRALSL